MSRQTRGRGAPAAPAEGTVFGTCNFDDGTYGDMSGVNTGLHTIATDATSTGGLKSLRLDYTYNGGSDQISGVYCYGVTSPTKKVYARMRYKIDGAASNQIIKKTVRFRTYENGTSDVDAGALDIYTGASPRWMWNGGLYSQTPYNIFQDSGTIATHGPDSFLDTWRCLEVMLDYTDPNTQVFKCWVDETLIIDYAGTLDDPAGPNIPPNHGSPWYIKDVHFLGTFNASQARTEWADDLKVSDTYMGPP